MSVYFHLLDPPRGADGRLAGCGPVAGGEDTDWYCKVGGDLDDNGNIVVVPFAEALAWTFAPAATVFLLGLMVLWIQKAPRFREGP